MDHNAYTGSTGSRLIKWNRAPYLGSDWRNYVDLPAFYAGEGSEHGKEVDYSIFQSASYPAGEGGLYDERVRPASATAAIAVDAARRSPGSTKATRGARPTSGLRIRRSATGVRPRPRRGDAAGRGRRRQGRRNALHDPARGDAIPADVVGAEMAARSSSTRSTSRRCRGPSARRATRISAARPPRCCRRCRTTRCSSSARATRPARGRSAKPAPAPSAPPPTARTSARNAPSCGPPRRAALTDGDAARTVGAGLGGPFRTSRYSGRHGGRPLQDAPGGETGSGERDPALVPRQPGLEGLQLRVERARTRRSARAAEVAPRSRA